MPSNRSNPKGKNQQRNWTLAQRVDRPSRDQASRKGPFPGARNGTVVTAAPAHDSRGGSRRPSAEKTQSAPEGESRLAGRCSGAGLPIRTSFPFTRRGATPPPSTPSGLVVVNQLNPEGRVGHVVLRGWFSWSSAMTSVNQNSAPPSG
jgi:hypothetical protein